MRLVKCSGVIEVSCLRCGLRKPCKDMMTDLDGPSFQAYFCMPGCVPHDTADITNVYIDRNWQLIGDGWIQS